MTQGIILAAGLGSRLKEVTATIPKSLIRVNGKPVLERNIEFMREAGFDRVVLVVGYMAERFAYLPERYRDLDLRLVRNDQYATSNTVSSLFAARRFFDRDAFIVTADIYLAENPYLTYSGEGCFYVLRPDAKLSKPEWIAHLDDGMHIRSVDQCGFSGHSYTGISHWTTEGLSLLERKLMALDWDDPAERARYWDELMLPDLGSFDLRAKVLASDGEVYEFDDMGDIEKLKRETGLHVEFQEGSPFNPTESCAV